MSRTRLVLLLLVIAAVAAFFLLDLGRFLSFDAIKAQQGTLRDVVATRPLLTATLFFALYVAVTALSVPGATVLTLAAGAIFGLGWGLAIVSFASTLGATLAFLAARFVLRDAVQARFADKLTAVNAGIARDGAFYLFTLRLVPLFPFFLINLLMGLTRMPARTFAGVSQVGMLAGTAVYVNAGTQLAALESPTGLLSPGLLGAFALLGVFPLLARKGVALARARRVYAGWQKPARFDRNLVVIGGGSAGLVTAYIAAAVKARVTLVEQHRLGGDCLNTGCVPSKALIRSAKVLAQIRRAGEFGIDTSPPRVDFAAVMARVQEVIRTIEPHDSAARYEGLGVEVIAGRGKLVSPWSVEIARTDGTTQTLTARAIVIAAGARPFVPPIPGLAEAGYLTSDTVWSLRECPPRLVVLGGGPIGCELAQAFARLGSRVTQVEMADRLMAREDVEVSARVAARFRAEGIDLRLGHAATRVIVENGDKSLIAEHDGHAVRLPFDAILVAVGRSAHLDSYGLEELGIATGRTIAVNDCLQTTFPNIYAAGDVAGPFQFTHTAAHQAWYAAVNALFAPFKTFKADYSVIPWATFVEPEVARVGLNEQDARAQGTPVEVTTYGLDDLDRAIADGAAEGFVKVLTVPGRDRILGVTIVGEHAGELIAEFVLAMRHGIGLNKLLGTIHIYPTLAEANKYAAGVWKKAHAPAALLRAVARFHAWRRGA